MRALLRADASADIGTGHVMRCLALAQALRDIGSDVVLAHTVSLPAGLEERLSAEGIALRPLTGTRGTRQEAGHTADLAADLSADWLVVDGYAFGAEYLATLRSAPLRVLVFDDHAGLSRYPVDIVVNQNAYADAARYAGRTDEARLLLGPRFAVLRRDFAPWRDWQRSIPRRGRRVAVTLGGSDPADATSRVLAAFHAARDRTLDVRVAVGAANPRHGELTAALGRRVELLFDVRDMPALLAWADVGIGAGGTSALEIACMGLPALLFVLADNQVESVAALTAAGIARALGRPADAGPARIAAELCELLDDPEAREAMAHRGRELVDGRGARRVAREMLAATLRLRPVTEADAELLWGWANDSATRAASFTSDPIPWETHRTWLRSQLRDRRARLYLGLDGDRLPIGIVRFGPDDGDATISVTVAPGARGRGYGTTLISLGCEALLAERPATPVHAYIKPDNVASLRAFSDAGFARRDDVVVRGQQAIHMVLG